MLQNNENKFPNISYKTYLFFIINVVLFFLFINSHFLMSQDAVKLKVNEILDTTQKKAPIKSPSGIDSVITFYSLGKIKIDINKKIVTLIDSAQIDFKKQKLTASTIEIDFNTSDVKASLTRDSAGKAIGIPNMNDNGEEFFGEELVYNMKTSKGVIKSGETHIGEGYYFGTNIKRISKTEMFIKDGYYTTCDAPTPHYHFGSDEMKMSVGDKLFADPLYLYVEDIPVFAIPFGLYLPMQHGRRSGLIVPTFYFSKDRGVVFQNFGFYWAASNYWDTKITTDIYTKGGFIINNSMQWNLKNVFTGSSNISFGNTRYSLDDDFAKEWKFSLNHSQTISPFENASINLNFASQDFNRNTQTDLNSRTEQSIRSSAAYSRTFENGVNTSISFQNEQNIITNEYTGSVPLNISVPQTQFLKKIFNIPANNWYSWVRDMAFSYRGNTIYNFNKRIGAITSRQVDTGIVYDTAFASNSAGYISHTPTISITPKLGYFNITPSINLGANNYFRKVIRNYDAINDSVTEEYQRGFFTEYHYSFGFGISTRLYGIADSKKKLFGFIDPNLIGIKAFRHTYQPSLNFNWTPDFSTDDYDFYGTYYNEDLQREVKYSYFEKEGGAHSSASLQKRLTYSDMHSFEIKRSGKKSPNDTTDTEPQDENMEILRLTINLSHNYAADSLKFSDISTTFRTPALKYLDLSGNASFTLYDEIKDTNNRFNRINQFLISNNKGLMRLTNVNININTSFSSDGIIANTMNNDIQTDTSDLNKDTSVEKSNSLGNRFLRSDVSNTDGDIWGENTAGYSNFTLPWSVTLGLNYSYSRQTLERIDRQFNVNTSLNFTIAESWKISANLQYDFINMRLITPQLTLTKDLHCWDLTATWYPSGYNQGFYLRFGIKASQLRDLKIEKRDSPIFR